VLTSATRRPDAARADVRFTCSTWGQPVKIVAAERMIRLSGLETGHDIEIVFSGMRPESG